MDVAFARAVPACGFRGEKILLPNAPRAGITLDTVRRDRLLAGGRDAPSHTPSTPRSTQSSERARPGRRGSLVSRIAAAAWQRTMEGCRVQRGPGRSPIEPYPRHPHEHGSREDPHQRRRTRAAAVHPPRRAPARRGRVDPAPHRDLQPGRLGRLPDGRRRGARRLVAARHRHRGEQVLPQGRAAGRPRSRDQRAAGGPPHRAHAPRRRRAAGRLLRRPRGRRGVRGRAGPHAGAPDRRVQFAGLVQPRPVARVRHRRLGRQLPLGRDRRARSR